MICSYKVVFEIFYENLFVKNVYVHLFVNEKSSRRRVLLDVFL